MVSCQVADLWLGHFTQRKQGSAELLLGKSEQEISLILRRIGSALQKPAAARLVELDPCVMSSGQSVGANLLGNNKELVKLQVIVAQAAGDRRAPGKIFLDKGPDHFPLEALFVIHDIIRNAQGLGDAA